MSESKASLPWPGEDDRIVVEAMLTDPGSAHWFECREFVKRLVQEQANNVPRDSWEDIVQDAMMQIAKYLPDFRYQCSLRTWLLALIRSRTIGTYRKFVPPFPVDPNDSDGPEDEMFSADIPVTVEDELAKRYMLKEALATLQEYISAHAHPVRNAQILNMVLLENRSLEEAAKASGCSAPVAGYIVRSARRYVRERLGDQPLSTHPLASDLSAAYREQGKTYEQLAEQTFENLKRSAQESYTMAKELGVE